MVGVPRSVAARLTLTHLLVALSGVLIVACLGSVLFSTHYVAQRKAELIAAAESVGKAASPLLGREDWASLQLLTESAGSMLGGRACVFAGSTSPPVATSHVTETSSPDHQACPPEAAAGAGPSLDTVQVECQGLTYTVTVPVMDEATGKRLGTVLVRCPIAGVNRIVASQRAGTVAAALAAAALAVLLAMLAARSLSRPLAEISRSAQRLAHGDFSVRVDPSGPSELRTLAATVNWSADRLRELFDELSAERTKLADVLASMSEGVVALDTDGKVLLATDRARQLLGLAVDERAGPDLARVLNEGTADRPLHVGDTSLRVRVAPLTNGLGTVAVVVDVTEEERLEKSRRDFVASASHQLRAPLTSIRGYLQALSDGTARDAEEQARCLAGALAQVEVLRARVDRMLELSKLQAGAVVPELRRIAVRDIADRACETIGPMAGRKGVAVNVGCEGEPPVVNADPEMLLDALTNLLDNAIRHSPPEGIVEVRVAAANGWAELLVADRGPGLPEEEAERIWLRFHSGESQGAAGLGLAITREIVALHGGEVLAHARPGGGAVLGFRIPRDAASPAPG